MLLMKKVELLRRLILIGNYEEKGIAKAVRIQESGTAIVAVLSIRNFRRLSRAVILGRHLVGLTLSFDRGIRHG